MSVDKDKLLEECRKTAGFLMKKDGKSFYKTRLLEKHDTGSLFIDGHGTLQPGFKLEPGDVVYLRKLHGRTKSQWMMAKELEDFDKSLTGWRCQFGDTDVMSRAVYIPKKWLE